MIPNEAVEAAADAINVYGAKYVGVLDPVPLKDMSLPDREYALGEARAALEAAAPYIKAQAIDKAVEDAEGLGMTEIPVHALRFRADCYRNIGANLYGRKG